MDNNKKTTKYNFLHDHIAREPHIFEILNEIALHQEQHIKFGKWELASDESLQNSRNIKLPFTPTRNKNISYLIELLTKNYPDEIRIIYTFSFNPDPATKKINIIEHKEYTVSMLNDDLNHIQQERDKKSTESLLALLKSFRLFNLTKLIMKAKNRIHVTKLIKQQLGKDIFTFKNFKVNRHNLEISEDYAFHRLNYENVKSSLDIDSLQKIISMHSQPVARRLKNFGILNANFNDYRDTKLDYLLNILLEDIPASLGDKDLATVKNFHSLRTCLLKVDKIIDPLITISNDLVQYIKESGICKRTNLLSMFEQLDDDILQRWIDTEMDKHKILMIQDESGEMFIIDGQAFFDKISGLHQLVLYNQEQFSQYSHNEKQEKLSQFELLCNVGRQVISNTQKAKQILQTETNIENLKNILQDYSDYQKNLVLKSNAGRERHIAKRKKGFMKILGDFFKSFFGKKDSDEHIVRSGQRGQEISYSGVKRTRFSKDTRTLYSKIKNRSSKILALSDLLELTPENESRVDTIIEELRSNNLKIVIPIYNARTVLYPIRSQKYLIADVEYLLVKPDVIQSSEMIRDFTDEIVREKIKDEVIPGSAILAVEKYLLTLYRQKRAQMLRKGKKD